MNQECKKFANMKTKRVFAAINLFKLTNNALIKNRIDNFYKYYSNYVLHYRVTIYRNYQQFSKAILNF
jgi:hypothetical protein